MSNVVPFIVLSVEEMRRRFYLVDERPPEISISSRNVPEVLHGLIPLAQRWGISDDMLRLDALRKASTEEIEYLRLAIERFDDELDEWLGGPEAFLPMPTAEYLAFSNMRMAADGC